MGLFRELVGLAVDTAKEKVKEKAMGTLDMLADDSARVKYLQIETTYLGDIVDALESRLSHKGGEDDEYTEYEIRHIYAALSVALEKELCYYEYDFFERLESDGYNVDSFRH